MLMCRLYKRVNAKLTRIYGENRNAARLSDEPSSSQDVTEPDGAARLLRCNKNDSSPIRCPTGVLNGFPIKNSMVRAVTDPAKQQRPRTSTKPRSLLQAARRSHNKVGQWELRQALKEKQPAVIR